MRHYETNELENVPCDFCGSVEPSFTYVRADGLTVTECGRCGLAYLNPRPTRTIINEFYEKGYFDGTSRESGFGGLICNPAPGKKRGREPVPRAATLLREQWSDLRNKSILEIGCATGELLAHLKQAGSNVTGLEISEFAAEQARKKGVSVVTANFEQHEMRETYDAALAFEVIEHVMNPTGFMLKASRAVRRNGVLILSTPNYSGAHRHGSSWSGFQYSFEHLYFFSVDVLRRMGAKAGLELVYWETTVDPTGPPYDRTFVSRQINKVSLLSSFIVERGASEALRLLPDRSGSFFIPYGNGRTLTVVFRKSQAST
jgi:SAM-dependent methyltransferase